MAKAEYIAHLKRRLKRLEARMARDKERLIGGKPREKVAAAGDLALVEDHLGETREKLRKLEAEPEGAWEDFKAEIDEDLGHLERTFDRWVQHQEKP